MMILLFIPLGLLCLLVAFLCYRSKHEKQAITFALVAFTMLGIAFVLLLGTQALIEKLPPLF